MSKPQYETFWTSMHAYRKYGRLERIQQDKGS